MSISSQRARIFIFWDIYPVMPQGPCLKTGVLPSFRYCQEFRHVGKTEKYGAALLQTQINGKQLNTRKFSGGDLNPIKSPGNKESNAQNGKYSGTTIMKTSSKDNEDFAMLRKGIFFTSLNSADTKDSLASDKLQFSGFISPQISSGNSFLRDGLSEGIPIYSFCTDKHAVRAASAGSDSLLQWNSIVVDVEFWGLNSKDYALLVLMTNSTFPSCRLYIP